MEAIPRDAIAVGRAISGIGLEVTCPVNEQAKSGLTREMDYRIAMKIGETLCQKGVLDKAEYRRIERKLRQKFSPVWPEIKG